jgi:hypothetical protein
MKDEKKQWANRPMNQGTKNKDEPPMSKEGLWEIGGQGWSEPLHLGGFLL